MGADNASPPDAVIAACTALTEAYARGEIEPSEAAAAYVGRGNAYAAIRERTLATADYDRAIAIYDRAIGLASNNADIYLGRGNVSFLKRDYDRAIADYDTALAIVPNRVDAFLGRGRSFYQKKDYDRALASYDRALLLAPDHAEALAERGDVHEQNGQFEQAIEDYGRLIVLQPANPKAWNNRCWDRAITGQLEPALADCNEALRFAPDDAEAIDSRDSPISSSINSKERSPTTIPRGREARGRPRRCTAAALRGCGPVMGQGAVLTLRPRRRLIRISSRSSCTTACRNEP